MINAVALEEGEAIPADNWALRGGAIYSCAGFQLPEAVRVYQREYDLRSTQMLEEMADAIEGKPIKVKLRPDVVSLAFLEQVLQACSAPESWRFSTVSIDYFVTLFREIDLLTASLAKEITTRFSTGQNRPMSR
jgi:hypothetical protein